MAGKLQGKQGEDRIPELVVLQPSAAECAACGCPLLNRDWEAWIACCTKRFLRLARIIAGDDARAEEALQKSWIKVWRKLGSYRGAPRPADAPEAPVLDADEAARRERLYRLLDAAVGELSPMYREVIALRYGEGLSTGQAADRLHTSRSNVSTRLNRAVKTLRGSLADRIRGQAA